MKRYYSIIMMLAVMVAALSFSACDIDDDDINTNRKASLKIDGNAYYPLAYILENYDGGLLLEINGLESPNAFSPDKILKVYVYGCTKVSSLKVGETINSDDLYIEHYENGYVIALYENDYEIIDGSVTIQSVDRYEVKIKFNDLRFYLKYSSNIFGEDYVPQNPKTHIVSGTATFRNSLFKSNGDEIPFF